MHTRADLLPTQAFERAAAEPFFVGHRLAELRRE
jgi:hypothetical protein